METTLPLAHNGFADSQGPPQSAHPPLTKACGQLYVHQHSQVGGLKPIPTYRDYVWDVYCFRCLPAYYTNGQSCRLGVLRFRFERSLVQIQSVTQTGSVAQLGRALMFAWSLFTCPSFWAGRKTLAHRNAGNFHAILRRRADGSSSDSCSEGRWFKSNRRHL